MKIAEALDIMWSANQQGDHFPDALRGKLSLDEGCAVQLGMLARRVEGGETQAGWKIGLTSPAVREVFGADAPVFGYLLERGIYPAGHAFDFDAMQVPCVESELCITMGSHLQGPGITRDAVLDALASVAPSYEILERRADLRADLALGIADNVLQMGFVPGQDVKPFPRELDLSGIEAEILTNDETFLKCVSRDVIENQLDSIAWLANKLAEFGKSVEAGQRIMSGSYYPPNPVNKGEQWNTSFSGVGQVAVSFV
ncbi:MAG: hypothetical protein O7C61_05645 [SAR324 cluster bacterium]|nr:hypothetical protein [SAR324 cluster bacterium]